MRQLRIATIGDYQKWFSYFLMGTAQGSFLNGHLHYSIPIRQHYEEIENQLRYFRPHFVFCHMIFSENLAAMIKGDENAEWEQYTDRGETKMKKIESPIKRERFHEMLAKTRRQLGFKVLYQEGDAKRIPRYPHPITELVDLVLINSRQTEEYEKIFRVPTIHWPYFAMNLDAPQPSDNLFNAQMVFAGNMSPRNRGHLHYGRAEFLEGLKKHFNLKTFPNDNIKNTRFLSAEVASSAEVVLGINQGMNIPGYLDTRPFQYIGAGAFFFMDPSDAMNDFFQPTVHYVPYERHNVQSVRDWYNHYFKEHRDKVKEVRQTGFEYVQRWHTAAHRVKMAIDIAMGADPKNYPIYLNDIRATSLEDRLSNS